MFLKFTCVEICLKAFLDVYVRGMA